MRQIITDLIRVNPSKSVASVCYFYNKKTGHGKPRPVCRLSEKADLLNSIRQISAGFELNNLLGCNLDFLAGLRIPAFTRSSLGNAK